MYRLGHASPQAALRYQHATRERDVAIADAIDGLISGECEPQVSGQLLALRILVRASTPTPRRCLSRSFATANFSQLRWFDDGQAHSRPASHRTARRASRDAGALEHADLRTWQGPLRPYRANRDQPIMRWIRQAGRTHGPATHALGRPGSHPRGVAALMTKASSVRSEDIGVPVKNCSASSRPVATAVGDHPAPASRFRASDTVGS